jgi:hypothetical protein
MTGSQATIEPRLIRAATQAAAPSRDGAAANPAGPEDAPPAGPGQATMAVMTPAAVTTVRLTSRAGRRRRRAAGDVTGTPT